MRTALITGITGQDGLYLAELLLSRGYAVHGLIRGQNNPRRDLVEQLLPQVTLHNGDLTDMSSLVLALRRSDPDEVYNLGAISHVAYSWENASLTTQVTGVGVLNLLEAVRVHAGADPSRIRFYQASSSEMFGKVQEVPQRETTLLWPRSPYGVAKAFGHHMTINYRESYGMHASSGILFNHESPRRGHEFVTRKVTRAAAAIALGQQDELVLGDVEVRRDWSHARDVVRGMVLAARHDEPGDYVLASGRARTVQEFVEAAFAVAGVAVDGRVRVDESFVRPPETTVMVGNPARARRVLGWTPETSFEDLVREMVEADLAALR